MAAAPRTAAAVDVPTAAPEDVYPPPAPSPGPAPRDRRAGDEVVLDGLQARPELNGKRAKVLAWDAFSGRFAVALESAGEQLKVRDANLFAGRKVLVTVVSGLRGSGKSSLTRHVLRSSVREGLRVAYIADGECFGGLAEVGGCSSSALPAAAGPGEQLPLPEDAVARLEEGCSCCTRRIDFAAELLRLARPGCFEHVLVETAAEAQPRQLAELFRADAPPAPASEAAEGCLAEGGSSSSSAMAAPGRKRRSLAERLQDAAELDTMVTVIDGPSTLLRLAAAQGEGGAASGQGGGGGADGDAATSDGQEGGEKELQRMVKQLEFADLVVINGTERLATREVETLQELVRLLNPEAGVVLAKDSQVPLSEILGRGERLWREMEVQQPTRKWRERGHRGFNGAASAFSSSTCAKACCPPASRAPAAATAAAAASSTSSVAPAKGEAAFGVLSFTFKPDRPFHPARVAAVLDGASALPPALLRASGTAWLASRPLQRGVWSTVGGATSLAPGAEWWATVPRQRWPESVASLLQGMALLGPDGRWTDLERADCHTELEVVCHRSSRAAVEASLDALLLTDAEAELGHMHWASMEEGTLPEWAHSPSDDTLSCLALAGAEGLLEALCARRADPNARNTFNGGTGLHAAALKGRGRSVEALLCARADPSVAAARGMQPLHLAVSGDVVELLCAAGAGHNAVDESGHTALHHAASMGKTEVVAALLARKAQVDALTTARETPLRLAKAAGAAEVVRLLLEARANPGGRH